MPPRPLRSDPQRHGDVIAPADGDGAPDRQHRFRWEARPGLRRRDDAVRARSPFAGEAARHRPAHPTPALPSNGASKWVRSTASAVAPTAYTVGREISYVSLNTVFEPCSCCRATAAAAHSIFWEVVARCDGVRSLACSIGGLLRSTSAGIIP